MKRLMIAGLTAGFSLAASAVTVEVVSGYAESKTLGDYEFLIVKSNSTLRVGGQPGTVDVLAVGGGGGGGAGFGGGGGGGAVVEQINIPVTEGDYDVVVGAGGSAGTSTDEAGKGGTSSAFGVSALGGGAGGFWGWDTEHNVGATGGGAGAIGAANGTRVSKDGLHHDGENFRTDGAPGTPGLGFGGGVSQSTSHSWVGFGGGGGGAGGPGRDAINATTSGGSDGRAGEGGIGVCSMFTGEPIWYGGGGGGGADRGVSAAAGGKGGGGQGGGVGADGYTAPGRHGTRGEDFTGGGGGGASGHVAELYHGSAGGCGLVIVRYRREGAAVDHTPLAVAAGEATRVINGPYEVYHFVSNALLRVNGSQVADILVVGGGGGGGTGFGGGGGGGGVVYREKVSLADGLYGVVIGAGGAGAKSAAVGSEARAGEASSACGVTALGGGAGGTRGLEGASNVGATGGGAGAIGDSGKSRDQLYEGGTKFSIAGAHGTEGQGFGGGACTNLTHSWTSFGGGGGGAGGPGGDAKGTSSSGASDGSAGVGGIGVMCAISGSEEYYGGGGGGGAARAKGPASGGLGGGGAGSKSESADLKNGVPGTDGLGGGGGGGGRLNDSIYLGARGGRGTVYIRLLRSPETVEPTEHEEGVATGGDVYRKRHGFGIHTFTTSGMFALTEDATVDLLMVGGGGGGGAGRGGGGGAGGVIVCTNLALQAGSYDVTVGAGGEGCLPSHTVTAENGKASSLVLGNAFVLSVPGGGAGGTGGWETKTHAVGFDGASGGGAGHYGYWGTEHPVTDGGKGMAYYGHDGGASYTGGDHFRCYGGGGGGAGEKGGDAVLNVAAGKGGDGIWCDFSGLAVCYGGGGGGGDSGRPTVGGAGGAGGGGTGGTGDVVVEGKTGYTSGSPGEDGLGGGGGGGGGYGENCGAGGKGGSGVVIIRYHLKKKGMLLIVR